MINRQAIETTVRFFAQKGSKVAPPFAPDACELMALLCRTQGCAKGYQWSKHAPNWRDKAAAYAFKEVTLAGLKELS